MNPSAMTYTLPTLVQRAARLYGRKEAVVDGSVRLNWEELDALRRRAARAFIQAGIRKGDRIAVQAPNIHEFILAAMGMQSLGAIMVPLNTRFKGPETADILRRSGARMLFTVHGFLDADYVGMLAGESLPELERIVLLRGEAPGLMTWAQFLAEGETTADDAVDARAALVKPDDIADVMFTSGTTGRPKGAMLSHLQNIKGYETASAVYRLSSDDVFYIVPPFFHTFGYKSGWLVSVIRGAKILPAITFDVDAMLPLIEKERISALPGPPTVFYSILEHPRRHEYDLSSLRMTLIGATSIPVALVRRIYAELSFKVIALGYGLTENTAVVTLTRPEDSPEKVATTSGKPVEGVELRIIDADGNPLPANQPGEIVLRGYLVMKGYYNDPEGTARAIDKDGWLHTGDIGLLDDEGYLKVTDRLKDMYIVGGFNCYPAEIENMLTQMPGVLQAAVIGIPDERMGEVGKAFILRKAGATITEADVIAWSREHMANYKVPRRVEFVDAFPSNASGKVLKTELRKRG